MAAEMSPHIRGWSPASSRTMSSRTGSPSVRMIVARSSDEVAGWGMRSRVVLTGRHDSLVRNFHNFGTIEMTNRTLKPTTAYALVAAVIGLALFASGTPSPLYTTYRELWGFSPVILTLVYATYA